MKKNLHPKWFSKTPVYCNGRLVKIVSSTQNRIMLDIWSGTHPFFISSKPKLSLGGSTDRFLKKYSF
jgi:large subunit ribosomal protein L31